MNPTAHEVDAVIERLEDTHMKWREGNGEWHDYPADEPETHRSYAETSDWTVMTIIFAGLAAFAGLVWASVWIWKHW